MKKDFTKAMANLTVGKHEIPSNGANTQSSTVNDETSLDDNMRMLIATYAQHKMQRNRWRLWYPSIWRWKLCELWLLASSFASVLGIDLGVFVSDLGLEELGSMLLDLKTKVYVVIVVAYEWSLSFQKYLLNHVIDIFWLFEQTYHLLCPKCFSRWALTLHLYIICCLCHQVVDRITPRLSSFFRYWHLIITTIHPSFENSPFILPQNLKLHSCSCQIQQGNHTRALNWVESKSVSKVKYNAMRSWWNYEHG